MKQKTGVFNDKLLHLDTIIILLYHNPLSHIKLEINIFVSNTKHIFQSNINFAIFGQFLRVLFSKINLR